MRRFIKLLIISSAFVLSFTNTFAQDKTAELTLSLSKEDSLNVCKVTVVSEGQPVSEVSVKLSVKRLFGTLPIAETATDEAGIASFEVPNDIPGDEKGNLTIIAKIEDDENYQNVATEKQIDWGVVKKVADANQMGRSLSANREHAPIYFMVFSNMIIICIWGTILYVVLQVFKIKRISTVNKKV